MTSHGRELGIDLSNLWDAGQNKIKETVVSQLNGAADAIPLSIGNWFRSGSWSAPDSSFGPMYELEAYATGLHEILSTTASNLSEVGDALVWLSTHYRYVDDEAQRVFESRRRDIENGAGTH